MSDGTTDTAGEEESAPITEKSGEQANEPARPQYRPPATEAFDWRGWVLVAGIVVSFLVIPGLILFLPATRGLIEATALSYRQAYLGLPLIPAFLLGTIAVWSAVRARTVDRE